MDQSSILAGEFGSEWKRHPLYHNYYFSRDGRCANAKEGDARLLAGGKAGTKGEYLAITFRDNGKNKREMLHRVICWLFNGPPEEGQHCRHLDGVPSNCAANNLAWGTHKQNMEDMVRHGRSPAGERNPNAKLTREKVSEMRAIRAATKQPYHVIGAQFGVSAMSAHSAINGDTWA